MSKRLTNKQINIAINKCIKALKNLNKHGIKLSGKLGWYKTKRLGPTGVGKTLLFLLGKGDSNKQTPEFFNCVTLKSNNEVSNRVVTLFSQNPEKTNGKSTNNLIRQKYGYPDPEGSDNKVFLFNVTKTNRLCKPSNHYFKMIKTQNHLMMINDDPGKKPKIIAVWSMNNLNKAMVQKYKKLIIVNASHKKIKDTVYYRYNSVYVINQVSIKDFLKSMNAKDKNTFVDVRLGVYRTGSNKNKKHDNGTGFRITLPKLLLHVQPNSLG